MNSTLTEDKVWISKRKYDEAERRYYEKLAGRKSAAPSPDKIWVQKFKYDEAEKKYYEKLAKLQKQKEDHIMSKVKPNEGLINGIKKPSVTDSIKLAPCSMRRLPNSTAVPIQEKIWLKKSRYDEAEKSYYEKLAKLQKGETNPPPNPPEKIPKPRVQKQKVPSEVEIPQIVPSPPETKVVQKKVRESKIPVPALPSLVEVPSKPPQPTAPPVIISEEKHFKPKESKRSKTNKKAERNRSLHKEDKGISTNAVNKNSLAGEVAKARQHIKSSLECIDDIAAIAASNANVDINNRLNVLEKEKASLKQQVTQLTALVKRLELRVSVLEKKDSTPSSSVTQNASPKPATTKPAPPRPAPVPADDEDDGVDLFGSDSEEEDPEAQKVMEKRLAEYAAKKSKKPALIAKSNIILDVKPWDDETDMKVMEAEVRKITKDGLVWGASKLVPLAYGIHKLQISCVVEDEKVSVDWLEESIQEITDYVQSVDIAAFNKV